MDGFDGFKLVTFVCVGVCRAPVKVNWNRKWVLSYVMQCTNWNETVSK